MNIEKLLLRAKINWNGSHELLKSDLEGILNLIGSLPEPKNLDISFLTKYSALAEDEYDKKAQKTDLLDEDNYKI